ncbi:MAG: pyruvate kinase [Candidatus Omnitrophica bacterium]|nr:pyruvate kinase [Candidatus Omnitrophota bacterium]MCB9721382.1 pyruvate kinase [Candidatus Omnitrophota bacterium]
MHINRYTKIICTIGPASNQEDMLLKMAQRGMNKARINCSHGTPAQHQKIVDLVNSVNQHNDFDLGILVDLEGYRIRIGKMKKNVPLNPHEVVYISNERNPEPGVIPLDFDGDLRSITKGLNMFLDDGTLQLRVLGHSGSRLELRVIQGGILRERKGVNIPGLKLQSNIMTEKDSASIDFALRNQASMISQSFVRNKKDIQRVMAKVKPHSPGTKVIAKIESEDGLRNVESILDECDGLMVARGDLGVSLPIYKIPIVQKYLIRHCNRKKKLSITATQMLDSMIERGQPTRAEVSDVANAIIDGTDYVMLSGETAVGKYPSRSVQMMSQIVSYTEKHTNVPPK